MRMMATYFMLYASCFMLHASCFMLTNPALNPIHPLPPPSAHGTVKLVEGGRVNFVIVWDSHAESNAPPGLVNRPIRDAVRTLRREFFFCTGEDVPVVDVAAIGRAGAPRTPFQILVGKSLLTDRLGIKPSSLPPEGFMVSTFSNGVAIVGNDSSIDSKYLKERLRLPLGPRRSTLWGVYDFVERFLGCRYYYPGPDGAVRPHCERLELPPLAYTDAPRFRNRSGAPGGVDGAGRTVGRELIASHLTEYQAASRMARTEPYVSMHSPAPEAWAAAHSNWINRAFMHNLRGKVFFNPTNHCKNYFNVTSMAFADELAKSHRDYFASGGKNRQGLYYDNERYCVFGQCDSFCPLPVMLAQPAVWRKGLITEEHMLLGSTAWYADVYGRFYHRLAGRINEYLPGKKLVVLAYAGCVYPPLLPAYRKLPENLEAGVCLAKMPRFIRNDEARRESVDILRRWYEALGGRPVRQIWTYNAGNTCFEQAVANEFLSEMIGAFGEYLGDVGINVETGMYPPPAPGFEVALHFYYATYCACRAQWGGAAFNAEAALDEHWRLFYGDEGGELLRKLHHTLKDAFLAVSVREACAGSIYPPEELARIGAELNVAKQFFDKRKGSVEWRRYRLMSYPLEFELERQRAIHAGKIRNTAVRLRYIQGDE